MQPHLQRIERERAIHLDDDLTVDHEISGLQNTQHRDDFRKVSAERLARLCPQVDLIASFEGKAAEAVPFGFVLPLASAVRQRGGSLCLHRFRVQWDGERRFCMFRCHAASFAEPSRLIALAIDLSPSS